MTQRLLFPQSKNFPGKLEFPGGKLELEETEQQCLERELQEELGITIKAGKTLGEFPYSVKGKSYILIPVLFECDNLSEIQHIGVQNHLYLGEKKMYSCKKDFCDSDQDFINWLEKKFLNTLQTFPSQFK
ncbi:MAG: NUDIX domain-containing protein [Candidatus Pacearchaeota archaeon]